MLKHTTPFFFVLILFSGLQVWAQKLQLSIIDNEYSVSENAYIPNESPLSLEGAHEHLNFWNGFASLQGELEIIFPNGNRYNFAPYPSNTMHPDLRARYPEIIVGKGYDAKTGAKIYYDYNPYTGFRAVIITENGRWYVDPMLPEESAARSVYQRKHMIGSKLGWTCSVTGEEVGVFEPENTENTSVYVEERVHKYRIAVSATGEYTQFHGGTVSSALAAIVTSINRVNSVYEVDAAITFEIVPNNSAIIFTNPNTDPYENNSANQMINVVQGVINNAIGVNNYDIGHAFSTGAGGLAQLASVCGVNKARGITGRAAPVNDPFDIDYVAHEIGHQFGGRHTQNNSCNRSGQAAFEPFSASTIMGYAGICPPNLQSNSDDHFHTHSLQEITNFAFRGNGRFCATLISTGNKAPEITPTLGAQHMPILTPFYLSAEVSDPENDPMSFVWEQYDLGPSAQSTTIDQGPVYRSFSPQASSTQYFPRIPTAMNTLNILGERLVFAPRTLRFRLTARDNNPLGSAVSFTQVSFQAVGNQPFEITTPQQSAVLFQRAINVITWDPGNTQTAPISCESVRILLSTDNGLTFPHDLGVFPNAGAAIVYLPTRIPAGNDNRILIKAEDGIFYQVTRRFTISDRGLSTHLDAAENHLAIHPNPAQNYLNIRGTIEQTRIEIIDPTGRKIKVVNASPQESQVNIAELSKGAYIVRITDLKGVQLYQQRFIKN
ncbi:MAG: T9SS C-terminal target domain-containing protein [Flavobacteriales bacterium]|nr:MAG: T9SS C-terminal target domain-containing protein [Flavobacteriales bacterium]